MPKGQQLCGKHGWHEGNTCFQCEIIKNMEKKGKVPPPDIYHQRKKEEEEKRALKENQNLERERNELARKQLDIEKDNIARNRARDRDRVREETNNRRRLEAIEQEKADAEKERTELSRDEIERKRNNKAKQLFAAAASGDVDIIDDFVIHDGTIDVDEIYEGETALLRAIRANQTTSINHLLKRGADVNKSLSTCIDGGSKYNETIIDKLLEMGADIHSKGENGSTLLHWVVANSNPIFAKKMIEKGAEVNIPDSDGITPLRKAIDNDKWRFVEIFIEKGADTSELNKETLEIIKGNKLDELFEEAAHIIVDAGHGSISLLQSKLNLGYARAGRIMDQLHDAGIVGSPNRSGPREVLVHQDSLGTI